MQDNLKGVVTTFLYQANRGEGLPFENGDFRLLVNEVWHRKFQSRHSHHEKLPHIHNILEVRMILTGECAMQLDNRKVMLVNAVIERIKRQKLRGLLMDQKVSLKDIVRIMNYNDMTAFVRAFKRAEGITPNQFRKAMKVDP